MYVCVYARHAQKIAKKLFFSVRSTQFPFKLNKLLKKKPIGPQNTPYNFNFQEVYYSWAFLEADIFGLTICVLIFFKKNTRIQQKKFNKYSMSPLIWAFRLCN
jgi:hypothetical protein